MTTRVVLRADTPRLSVRSGPWVRRDAVARVMGPGDPAQLALLVDHRGREIAWATCSADADIVARVVQWGAAPPPDDWLERRVQRALAARAAVFGRPAVHSGYREINGEGDDLPGLIVDRYEGVRVVQLNTAPMVSRTAAILRALARNADGASAGARVSHAAPGGLDAPDTARIEQARIAGGADVGATIVMRPEAAAQREGFGAGHECHGPAPEALAWCEYGLRLRAPPPPGQKTGGYHDQRDNRALVAELARLRGGALLELGSHVAGFSVHAAARGVQAVAVDTSADALTAAADNAARNGGEGRLSCVRADIFGALDEHSALAGPFSTVVFDPPKLARHRHEVDRASTATRRALARLVPRCTPDALFVLCSCSHAIGAPQLEHALAQVGEDTQSRWTVEATRGAGPDHPVALGHAAGRYLTVLLARRVH